MSFSAELKELVRSRTDIVQLISQDRLVVQKGPNFATKCPWHDDGNPSLMIYPDRQSFRCWVCSDVGGDVFSWVMRHENVAFPEAMKILAERAHIELPKLGDKEPDEVRRQSAVYEALKWAQLELHNFFLKSPEAEVARQYVKQRGYNDETINKFSIGYHPNDWEWFIRRAQKQFDLETMYEARILGHKEESSRYYDQPLFVDRVVFPIQDERSRTVAFGGRLIPGRSKDDAAKYINSPESAVFQKSRILYGLPQAREPIREEKTVLVVEGYADCVACHQHGVGNTVATLGTALTETQCTRLKAFAPKIVLVYDSDDAGQRAAARGVGMLLGQSVDLRVLNVPQGKDPDEFLKAHGATQFKEHVANAQEAWEFRLNWEIKNNDVKTLNGREKVLTEMLNLLAKVPKLEGSPREALILGRLSSRLRVTEADVRQQLDRARQAGSAAVSQIRPAPVVVPVVKPQRKIDFYNKPLNKDDKLESEFIEIIFARPQLAERLRTEVGPDDFQNPDLQLLLQVIYDVCELGEEPTFQRVMVQMEDLELKGLAVWVSEQGRQKGIEQKLAEMTDGVPSLFKQNIDTIKWRREERNHQEALAKEALRVDGPDIDPFALLKKATEFHQKRATNRR